MNSDAPDTSYTGNPIESVIESLASGPSNLPFSFVYGSRLSRALLPLWDKTSCRQSATEAGTAHLVTYRDKKSGFAVQVEALAFQDYPAVEWVLRFTNTADQDSALLEQVHALDLAITATGEHEFVLNHLRGSQESREDFAPLSHILWACAEKRLSSIGGRSSDGRDALRDDGSMPVFEVNYDGATLICAVGWSGQWAASLKRDKARTLTVQAGMELTKLKLLPGESIRTARILLFFRHGEPEAARNAYRRLMVDQYTPKINGQTVQCPIAACGFRLFKGNDVDEHNQTAWIRQYVNCGLEVEAYWLDAGWYEGVGDWVIDCGNWTPKAKSFPRGLQPITDEVRKHDLGFVLWFDPERVVFDTWLHQNHPDWLLMPNDEILRKRSPLFRKPEALLDLGNREAWQWLVDHVSSMISQYGITVYRHDVNINPLEYWRAADAPDRQGISEIRHIEGLYAFWDELLRRHPGLMIDNCASGGRRIDLETCSRSVALWRTDHNYEPEAAQSHTLGINRYIPISAAGMYRGLNCATATDAYTIRSFFASGLVVGWDPDAEGFSLEQAKARLREQKQLRDLFLGDFYALTSHSTASDVWCAYQFHRPDLKKGAAFFFRRPQSPHPMARFSLRCLKENKRYALCWLDGGQTEEATGRALQDEGLAVELPVPSSCAVVSYAECASEATC